MNLIEDLMEKSLFLSKQAYDLAEVPVGAIIVDDHGNILSEGLNQKESLFDSTAHAEILAIRKAGETIGNWRLKNCMMVVTLEPCLMCLSAMVNARIGTLVFGAYDGKYGALSLGYHFHNDGTLNHKIKVIGGIRQLDCSEVLKSFFSKLRKS